MMNEKIEEISEWKIKELQNWNGMIYIEIYGKITKKVRIFFENDILELNDCYDKIEFFDIAYLQYFNRYIKEGKLFEMQNKKKGIIYSYYLHNANLNFFIKVNEIFDIYHLKGSIVYGYIF
jgi:hypothetical protein